MKSHFGNSPVRDVEEWLSLEISLALLGEKIADKMQIYYQEKSKAKPDAGLLSRLQAEVLELGRARQACYWPATQ